jgi:hypothetical protein
MQVNYEKPLEISSATTVTVATNETTLMTVTDQNFTRQTQLTVYFKVTLGDATNVKIRYYMSPDNGTTWYCVPIKNKTTAILEDTPSVIYATSPTVSGVQYVIEDLPMSATTAIKITGQATGAAATLNKAYLWVRDN